MQKDDIQTIQFAAITCLVCSLALAGVRTVLLPRQQENIRIDRQTNILKALSPDFDPDGNPLTAQERDRFFTEGRVNKAWIPLYFDRFVTSEIVELPEGATGELFTLTRDGNVVAYAFPAEGKGLWSTVHSFVGLEADLATIRGVTFFDHQETPGLGGEASKPWFQRNFQGQRLWRDGEPVTLRVVKGGADPGSDTEVDGMSGATITGNGIQRFVNNVFRAYDEAVFQNLRGSTEGES